MNPSADELAAAVNGEAAKELDAAVATIQHCLAQLTDEQLWWRPETGLNSIANLLLHLSGNLRQWIVAGIGGADDTRQRPLEFSQRGPIPKAQLIARLTEAVEEAKRALSTASASILLSPLRIQGFDVTGLEAIFHAVTHFRGHTQEIVHMTRCQLGDRCRFKFVPATPEQGAGPA